MDLIHKYRKELDNACFNHKVEELYAFGSILTNRFDSESDIDFIVSILLDDPLEYAENYFSLKFELEEIFKRRIDLLEQKAIRNPVFEQLVSKKKFLVYESRQSIVNHARRGPAAARGEGEGYAGWRGLQQLDFPRRDALGIGYFFIKEKVSIHSKTKILRTFKVLL